MLYMIELNYLPEKRDEALKYFQEHGLTHFEEGVAIEGAWVATHEHVAYVLATSKETAQLEKACEPLAQFGTVSLRPVTDVDQI